jgi:hypothetical protein
MAKILSNLIAVVLLAQVLLQGAASYAAGEVLEVKLPARESFREFYNEWGDDRTDSKNGVVGQHTKITVSAAELPYPLLKYRFNTYITETGAGNAAPLYAEAAAVLLNAMKLNYNGVYNSQDYAKAKFPDAFNIPKEQRDDNAIEKLLFKAFPVRYMHGKVIDVIPAEREEWFYSVGLKEVYRLVGEASKRRDCDWSYRTEYNGIGTNLAYLDDIFHLSRFLRSKAEWEIRNGKYDEAVKTIRLGWRLAEHIERSDMPCFVVLLSANAVKGQMLYAIQLLGSQPDAPNLYPALTQLNVDKNLVQKAMQVEHFLWISSKISSPQKMQELFEQVDERNNDACKTWLETVVNLFIISSADSDYDFSKMDKNGAIAAVCVMSYPYGKERLLKRGLTEEAIDKLTVYQVVAPYIAERIRAAYDKTMMASALPVDFTYQPKNPKEVSIDFEEHDFLRIESPADLYLSLLFPACSGARGAFLRIEQTIDLLQITEAIRYYAAVNDGKLPESLDEIEQLYVKKIAVSDNKPFKYRVEGNTAIIDHVFHLKRQSRLEITVEKVKK